VLANLIRAGCRISPRSHELLTPRSERGMISIPLVRSTQGSGSASGGSWPVRRGRSCQGLRFVQSVGFGAGCRRGPAANRRGTAWPDSTTSRPSCHRKRTLRIAPTIGHQGKQGLCKQSCPIIPGASILAGAECFHQGGEVAPHGVFLEIRGALSSRLRRSSFCSPIKPGRGKVWSKIRRHRHRNRGGPVAGPEPLGGCCASGFPRLARVSSATGTPPVGTGAEVGAVSLRAGHRRVMVHIASTHAPEAGDGSACGGRLHSASKASAGAEVLLGGQFTGEQQ